MSTPTESTFSLEHARPQLRDGEVFGSLVSTSTESESCIFFESSDGRRQVALPRSAATLLPLLDGTRTIPDILESLHKSDRRISFKSFFSTLQKLQINDCLIGAEALATPAARARAEMYERPALWLTRPILSFEIGDFRPRARSAESSVLAFVLFSVGTLIVTLSFILGSLGLGLVQIPTGFLRIDGSYVRGLLFYFFAASVLMTVKTIIKAILSMLLTGVKSPLKLELAIHSLSLRTSDDKIYMAGGQALGSLAFATVASSYFFIFALASAVAPHWNRLDDLFWISAILLLIDLNPFRKSDLSSYFNVVLNRTAAVELLPYLKNRSLLSFKKADSGLHTLYSSIALIWTMLAFNLVLALINRNDTVLAEKIVTSLRQGPWAEAIAAGLIAVSLFLTFALLTFDILRTVVRNVMHPIATESALQRAKRRTKVERLENVEALAKSLTELPLFSALHPDAILFLLSQGRKRLVPKGTHIIVQSAPSNELFILLEGEAIVQKRRDSGAVEEIARLKAVSLFGENSVLSHAPRSADVVAKTAVQVIVIPRAAIDELNRHPNLKTEAEVLLDRLVLGQHIAQSELFKEAPLEAASLFFNEGTMIDVGTGRHIVEQGRSDKDFYLIVRGSVEVFRSGLMLTKLEQGEFFGEMALILNAPRSATVITREPCRLLKLSSEKFWRVLTKHPAIALYLENVTELRHKGDSNAIRP